MAADIYQELQEERLKIHADMQALNSKDGEWSPEDQSKWDAFEKRYDEILAEQTAYDDKLKRLAKLEEIDQKMDRQDVETRSEVNQARQERSGVPTERQKCDALQGWMRYNNGLGLQKRHEEAAAIVKARTVGKAEGGDTSAPMVTGWMTQPQFFARHQPHTVLQGHGMYWAGSRHLPSQFLEKRADANLSVADEPEVIPEGFMAELSQALLAWGGFRRIARIISTGSGNPIDWPTGDDTGNTGALLAEATSFGDTVKPTIADITLLAYKYSSKPIKISAELLEDSGVPMARILGEMLGIRIGRITSTHYATGDNSGKPQGVTVFASAGKTAAATGAVTAEELIDLQGALDPAWEGNSSWAMNKATLTSIRKLRSDSGAGAGTGNFLWQPGLQAGTPDMLLGAPIAVIQEMPAMAASAVPITYGDHTQYIIRDAGTSRFYRLEELYRATDQTGMVMFARHDGRGLQSGAIKKMTMAAV